MAQTAQNIFQKIREWSKGFSIWVCVSGVLAVVVGINHYAEDVLSTYNALRLIENTYALQLVTWEVTYWTLSFSFDLAQTIFFYLYGTTGDKKAAYIALAATLCDAAFDTYYRANGQIGWDMHTYISAFASLVFYTIMSNVFLSLGIGIVLATWTDAIKQIDEIQRAAEQRKREATRLLNYMTGDNRQNNNQQRQPNNQPRNNQPQNNRQQPAHEYLRENRED